MSPGLRHFLSTKDLDDLLDARQPLATPTPSDTEVIEAVISEWRDEQAVSNLLIHSSLIPPATRAAALQRGLDEREHPYFVLAAVVGAPGVLASGSDGVRPAFRDRLLRLVAEDETVVAQRASVTLFEFLEREDAPAVVTQLGHSDDTVRHNLLAWLVSTFEKSNRWLQLVEESSLPDAVKGDIRRRLADHMTATKAGKFTALRSPLLSYIPNLSEYR